MTATRLFSKSALGLAAIKTRDKALSVKQRMLMITIDGQKDLNALSLMCTSLEEARALCDELIAGGFIQATELPAAAATIPGQATDHTLQVASHRPPVAAASREDLAKMVRRAGRALENLVGPNGMHLVVRLEECKTLEQLEASVMKLRPVIATMQSEKKAEEFVTMALGR